MPFNPAQFVYQPRPLQQYDFGSGFRDLIETRFKREGMDTQKQQEAARLAETQAGRNDENTRFAATTATSRATQDRALQLQKYQQAVGLVDAARKASNTGDWNTADALGPRILELGGTYKKEMGPDGKHPVYTFQAPGEPGASPVDYAGTRQQIFGGPGQQQSGPFQVPGFGANGQRNPFDSLPGASSAALPQAAPAAPPAPKPGDPAYIEQAPDPAGPPPGAAGDGPQRPMEFPPPQAPGSAPQAAPEQPPGPPPGPAADAQQPNVGPNPFDPFKVDTAQVGEQNSLRLDPYFRGAAGAFPGYEDRVNSINQGAAALNMPPEDTLKLWQPTLNTAAGLMKAQLMATSSGERLALSAENSGLTRNRLLENRVHDWQEGVGKTYNVAKTIEKLNVADGADRLAESAVHGNGQAATQLVAQLFRMNQSGVMTDQDFENASHGAVNIFQRVKDGTLQNLVQNGITLDQYKAIKEVLALSRRSHLENLNAAQNQLLLGVQRAGSPEEQQMAMTALMTMIPRPYWNDQVKEAFGVGVPQKTGPVDASGNYAISPNNGSNGKVSASASSTKKTKRVIDKDVKDIKDEELPQAVDEITEELRKDNK